MGIGFYKKIHTKPEILDVLILVFCYSFSALIVNPVGDFPLNDDWSFAITVKRFVEAGVYEPTGWTAMSLFTNILWGALFCFYGFSFTALRASTLLAALAGILSVYFGAKELGLARLHRVVAALTLAFNPIYYALSYTFMTDVLFSSLLIIGALFFLRCIKTDSTASLYIGTSAALAATMSRQLGIALPIAFAASYILLHGVNLRSLCRGLLSPLICMGGLAWYQHWLSATGKMTALYNEQSEKMLDALLHPSALMMFEARNAYVALLYFGMFLMPTLLLFVPLLWQLNAQKKINLWVAAMFVGFVTYIFSKYVGGVRLPLIGNILASFGIGPLTLKSTYIPVPELSTFFWSMLTGIAIFGGGLIFAAFILFIKELITNVQSRQLTSENSAALFLLLAAVVYLFVIFMSEMADRYLVPAIALLMLGILALTPQHKFKVGAVFCGASIILTLVFVVFSICTTRDYLAWNRARWQALNDLMQVQHVSSQAIDGGFEFNGFYLYDSNYREKPDKSWWWVEDDTYLISMAAALGYTTVKEYPYSHWLPPYVGHIIVQKKN